ncbi:MAG: DUF1801 domain-containing protein [Chitinophagaceae bacterium]|nr:DUF1801 domain-containing protein [Chitinophagaceae bacterium]
MQYKAVDATDYISQIPEERQAAMKKLRAVIKKNLPKGFKEGVGYGMMGWSVPHSLYPAGYHCKPEDPLPFMGIASQKNFIAVYHMGIYAIPSLHKWFVTEHAKASVKKLDMGKSCLRYKKPEDIPYDLIGELASKITPDEWIEVYEKNLKR